MDKVKFVRPSFGEKAGLGCMYDARNDTFLLSGILDSSMPDDLICTKKRQSKDCTIFPNDSWSTKFSVLDIPKNTCLGVLSGTVALEGFGRCFSAAHEEARESTTLMYQIKTVSEHIDIFSDELKSFLLLDALDNSNATHIVVKTYWGSTTYVSLNVPEQNGLNKEALINELNSALTNGSNMTSSIPKDFLKQVTITLLSDNFPEKKVLRNIGKLQNLIKSIQGLTSDFNNGKGNILSLKMIPISSLADKFNLKISGTCNSFSISDEIASRIVQIFDDMLLLKRQIQYIYEVMEKHKICILKINMDSIVNLASNVATTEKKFQNDLAININKVRTGEADQSSLENMLEEFIIQRERLQILKTICQTYAENSNVKFDLINMLKSKNVSIICTPEDADNLRFQNPDRTIYTLIYNAYSAREDSKNWGSQFYTFIYLIGARKADEDVRFAFLDNDLVGFPAMTTIAIHQKKGNEMISRDVHADVQKLAKLCLAYSGDINPEKEKSTKRGNVHIKCPGSFRMDYPCCDESHKWQCKICYDILQYGFDGYFYCSCGGAPFDSYEFKCSDTTNHTLRYIKFKMMEHLTSMLQEIKPYKELNIVILGETGVGKSTWINGFANYLTYDTLDMALAEEPLCLIPTSFTMRDKKKGASVTIQMGKKSKNENNANGQSSTQMPKSYVFFVNDTRIQLIDTPGIGDTRGIEQDRTNFQNIMSHLAFVNEIHGICILLKPNNSRLSVTFEFCIQELLTHLHKDACQNIVFVFTNARNTFYSAGDTFPLLENLLEKKIKGAIKLNENTEYYMDNESVRFLAAKRCGIEFPEDEYEIYAKSWLKAVTENRRLIKNILTLTAHQTNNTRSLNEARRLILELTKPLAEINNNIQDNILVIERKKAEIEAMDKNKKDLIEKLYIPHIELKSQPIHYPRTVCTSKSCIDVFTDTNGVEIRDYKTWCHEHCNLSNVVVEQYPVPELRRCAAMKNGKCTMCGCVWSSHMHITYTTVQEPTKIIDKNIENRINSESDAINTVNEFIKTVDDRLKKFNEEQETINATAAKFGSFLKSNAITPYNDATANYLKYQIRIEEGLVGKGSDSKKLYSLRDLLQKYEKEVNILEESMKDGQQSQAFDGEVIQTLVETLYDLTINGKMLKDMMKEAGRANVRMAEYHVIVHEVGSKRKKNNYKWSNAFKYAKDMAKNCYGAVQKFLPVVSYQPSNQSYTRGIEF